ncbi:ATP-binding protein [Planktothricoides raciborskii]|uniref:Serine/threonine-protein kinase PknK n=1 Tax=Planktothricoides raciborskii FACHB-1370 TaxID=2949576 RepID=A0ABR8EJY7_9CYAN|nr:serine/threonine-protein kinase PknK [Planktothricoides raciborskii]MBD2546165.1 serine/threonine-protein kinase PknK [Planktothricoides raciborskii FACHB-1370]MBD2583837.1 serine/threonine-protein kinase PknK [Planktothricoides raciborskii FACHB-1261]
MLKLPGYRLTALIETNSQNHIYRGIRESDGQKVIVKILTAEYPSASDLRSYQQEYAIGQNLSLPGAVKVYSLEYHQERPFLVFEDIEGISLKKYLAGSPLPLPKFLAIAIQITKIVGEIHGGNIIHKDINPSNIIINPSTNEVKIIDFGIATQLSRENPTVKNPHVLEGTLSYISPEQTGRMNRVIDYRSDFYSLGVTFYELVTGKLPFTSQDPLELVHCHLAIQPPSPQSICPEIPSTLANIVLKLMAKNAEERYQSAWGLLTDLQECQRQFNARGFIEPFALGAWDFADRFQIPQKLYGREAEIAELISAFERVSSSLGKEPAIAHGDAVIVPREIMLISGYSGIGKSALVAELHKAIIAKRGYFISGKFDQLQSHIPYSALINAFRELIEQILTESEEQLEEWREQLFSALGEQGQIIIDVIPELELIIGEQPAVAEVGLVEAQNRFNLLFKHFIRVFCNPERPLVLFLDDLQWSDLATLKFIEVMLNDPETKYLFLIGSYRDNEVNSTHPFRQTIDRLQSQGVSVNQIYLKPLVLEAVIQLIAETLHRDYTTVTPLAELVLHKTGGNPLFITQFLTLLYREKFLNFNPPSTDGFHWGWSWEIQEIQATNMTENVVELLVNQLQKLSLPTQQHLSLGACIGHTFQLDTLSVVSQKSAEAIAQDLIEAIADGLIIAEEHWQQNLPVYRYRFGHDRIQQAAYSLIPDPLKLKTHLTIGQLLLTHTDPEELDYEIFEILNHFNRSYGLIECDRLRVTIAELNLKAGLKAIKATAYPMAVNYLHTGLELLDDPESWNSQYELTRSLYKAISEAEYLNGNFAQAKKYLDVGLKYSRSNVEKAELYKILIIQYTLMAQYTEAIETGAHALSLLNFNLKPENIEALIEDKMAAVQKELANRSVDSLLNLPTISDPEKEMAVKLLISLDPPTYITASPLYALVCVKAVELSMQYGNVAESAKAYANNGFLVGSSLGNYQLGYQLGVLAVDLSKKFGSDSQKSQACLLLASWIAPWCQPMKRIEQINLEGYQAGLKSGEIQFAGYNLFGNISNKLIQGLSLPGILKDLNHYLSFALTSKNQLGIDVLFAIKKFIISLVGVDADEIDSTIERDKDISDREFVNRCKSSESLFALTIYYICQMQLCCITQDFAQGILYINPTKKILTSILGFTLSSEYYYYASLLMLNQPNWYLYLNEITKNQQTMSQWVTSCPKNFQHKLLLIEAEQARRNENILEAMDLYDRAIALAKENEFLQDQALANEMAGYFYLDLGKEHFAKIYLSQSYSCYDLWGAKTKLKQLEANYSPYIVQTGNSPEFNTTTISSYPGDNNANVFLDYAALAKNYQIIYRCL